MKWFIKCIKNYVTFDGRASRKEYWNFILFTAIFAVIARTADIFLFGIGGVPVFFNLVMLFIFLPDLAVGVRRLHDTGRSGKLVLWYCIAFFVWGVAMFFTGISTFVAAMSGSLASAPVGFLVLFCGGGLALTVWGIFFLVWMCLRGTPGDNKYGPDPKAVEA